MSKYITQNSKILGGTPVLSGTRIPVSRIMFLMLKESYTIDNILEDYPQIPKKLLEGAIDEYIQNYGSQKNPL